MKFKILKFDQKLFQIVHGINILDAISPLNFKDQRAGFLTAHYSHNPSFCYKEHKIDVLAVKRALFNLPFEKIVDPDLQQLYLDVVLLIS